MVKKNDKKLIDNEIKYEMIYICYYRYIDSRYFISIWIIYI